MNLQSKMSQIQNNNGTIFCTVGGTLLSVLSNIHSDDLVKTCLLAAIGATVSFIVSLNLKGLVRIIKKKK
ncbi:hypothetical protein CHU_1186 [Cytophaga hutchinsonii ATCC 33406]|uniref:Uncharacterized protein n=1 Tax=Cytophaga hutchinsonii (strain ATCC 33406 / DSM 1761 / CIP 103989 / NBRC 15051 / NCIMB 9469 / D465) TaxID=269798 RepID=A0A6N4SQ99_CYTH3|nr:hypothetical protein CHU_1186 [Cytophaga hutchinsonii ATCC 33406]